MIRYFLIIYKHYVIDVVVSDIIMLLGRDNRHSVIYIL